MAYNYNTINNLAAMAGAYINANMQNQGLNSGQASSQKAKPPEVRRKETPKKFLYAEKTRASGSCGVGIIHSFRKLDHAEYFSTYGNSLDDLHNTNMGGCGFLLAAFIDTDECKEMYLKLKGQFPILYQSDIRFNLNSHNNFFFCIFDTGEREPKFEEWQRNTLADGSAGFMNGLEW